MMICQHLLLQSPRRTKRLHKPLSKVANIKAGLVVNRRFHIGVGNAPVSDTPRPVQPLHDCSCCGLILPSLHDLLQHYEEAHAEAQKSSQQNTNATDEPVMPDSRAAIATNRAASVQQEASTAATI